PDQEPDGLDKRKRAVVREVALRILNRRLARLTKDHRFGVLSAAAGHRDLQYAASSSSLSIMPRGKDFALALESVLREVSTAIAHPAFASEIGRATTTLRASRDAASRAASTRWSGNLAEDLAEDLSRGRVFTTPAFDLSLFDS